MAIQEFHIACLDTTQANSLGGVFITASLPNASSFKAVALEDTNFASWVGRSIISQQSAPPQTAIQKLFDLSGYPEAPVIAIMPVASSSISEVTTCNLYQFENETFARSQGWKVPAIDGNPIAPAGTNFTTLQDFATALGNYGGLLYYYDTTPGSEANTILN